MNGITSHGASGAIPSVPYQQIPQQPTCVHVNPKFLIENGLVPGLGPAANSGFQKPSRSAPLSEYRPQFSGRVRGFIGIAPPPPPPPEFTVMNQSHLAFDFSIPPPTLASISASHSGYTKQISYSSGSQVQYGKWQSQFQHDRQHTNLVSIKGKRTKKRSVVWRNSPKNSDTRLPSQSNPSETKPNRRTVMLVDDSESEVKGDSKVISVQQPVLPSVSVSSKYKFVRKLQDKESGVKDVPVAVPEKDAVPVSTFGLLPEDNRGSLLDKKRRRTSSNSGSQKLMSKYRIVKLPSSSSVVPSTSQVRMCTPVSEKRPMSIKTFPQSSMVSNSKHKFVRTINEKVYVQSSSSSSVSVPPVLSKYKFAKAREDSLAQNVFDKTSVTVQPCQGITPAPQTHEPLTASKGFKPRISKYKVVRKSPCRSISKEKPMKPGFIQKGSKYKFIKTVAGHSPMSAFKKSFRQRSVNSHIPERVCRGSRFVSRGSQHYKVSRTKLRRISASGSASQMLKTEGAQVLKKGDSVYAVTANRMKRINSLELTRLPPPICQKAYISTIARARNRSLATLSWIRKKSSLPCIFLVKFGKCARQASGKCPYDHTPKTADVKKVMPVCQYFLEGRCRHGEDCPYPHVKHNARTPICLSFISGKCLLGDKCNKRHENVCADFKATGTCKLGRLCPLKHVKIIKKTKKVNAEKTGILEQKKEGMEQTTRYFENSEKSDHPDSSVSDSDELALKRSRLLKRIESMKNAIASASSSGRGSSDPEIKYEAGARPPLGILPDFIAFD